MRRICRGRGRRIRDFILFGIFHRRCRRAVTVERTSSTIFYNTAVRLCYTLRDPVETAQDDSKAPDKSVSSRAWRPIRISKTDSILYSSFPGQSIEMPNGGRTRHVLFGGFYSVLPRSFTAGFTLFYRVLPGTSDALGLATENLRVQTMADPLWSIMTCIVII